MSDRTREEASAERKGLSPLRQQYLRVKERYPGCILFFRLGDFYETFDDDARVTARELDLVLTGRDMGRGLRVPMAGVPAHAVGSYLGRLLVKGYRVAICEQVGPSTGSGQAPGRAGLMEREVVRVVTPGTVVEPALLEGATNNYLAALWIEEDPALSAEGRAGLAYADITTSEFAATELSLERLQAELERLHPAETISLDDAPRPAVSTALTLLPAAWGEEEPTRRLLAHFGATTLAGLGLEALPLAQRAVALLLRYLGENQTAALAALTRLRCYDATDVMTLDSQTRRNLELFAGGRNGGSGSSLLRLLDRTRTPMGARLLRAWLGQPLILLEPLQRRQTHVAAFVGAGVLRTSVRECLGGMGDVERLVNRARGGHATPRDLAALRRSLEAVGHLRAILLSEDDEALAGLGRQLWPAPELQALLARALVDDPPASLGDGEAIRLGHSADLDELRAAAGDGKAYLASLERRERERTGIRSLKVGFNRVFGYYIEVSTPNLPQVPSDYLRKQTLSTGERFYTPELKEQEARILNAEEQAADLEARLFGELCRQVAVVAEELLVTAAVVAQLDVHAALAEVAVAHRYVRPELDEGEAIFIKAGRHPVVEQTVAFGAFVPNDTELSNGEAQILLLTGPNMAGKSTYLRQVALIVLMAQIGSFVPAEEARIGLVDRIFTRIGAQDDLARGESTFMVEMVETAQILHQATARSLIILDEIGRGTSTYDGLAIARAVLEYLHHHPQLGAKTLFATHYHELTGLAETLPRLRNYHVAVAEEGERMVFRYQVLPGGASKSFGVHVAQLAGLPRPIIDRAHEVLQTLEGQARPLPNWTRSRRRGPPTEQLPLLPPPSPLLEALLRLDPDTMSPLDALTKLYELRQQARGLAD